ncbi:transporter substrate-binding domain-containing protein [Bacillus sp. REN16]|uniref:transporter substrate-binding domain-containing protein n=1 Tax=Bacillus sp. REN16 TaxID=2887296 RepID=UPI001E629EFA|nr:transporter substrate-binding domain-containing protein [Bacillus sp. REN16]MCC3358727.1 transporter substrate-binding domain-containing protein [Bacillus sp. REN16]
MKKFLLASLITILSLAVLAACGTSDDNATGSKEGTDAKKVLTMGTSADFPPFETIDEKTGEFIGFDIELAKQIADKLGYELKIENMDFGGLISALQAERLDFIISGMSATAERKESVDFSTEYHKSGEMFVTLKDSDVKKLEDLDGKKVGVQLGSIQEEGAKKIKKDTLKNLEISALNKAPELIQELKSGRIDAVYLDKTVAVGFIEELDLAGFDDPTEASPGMAVAFAKGSELTEEFNKVLEEMKTNGELEKLEKQWIEE